MIFGPSLRGLARVCLAVTLLVASIAPAFAVPAFEYRAAGLSIAVDLPDRVRVRSQLSNVIAVSGATTPERLLVPTNPTGRWRARFAIALVPGVAPYRSAVGPVSAEDNSRDLAAVPRGGSLAISYRAADGRMGLMLRISAAGMLHFAYDQPEGVRDRQRPGSGLLPVSGIDYMAGSPEAVPLPPAAPLLAGALLLLAWRGRRS